MSKPTAFPLDESRLPFEIPRDEPYREKIARLGQMITDRIPAKKGILTKDDPEYWGLASIVTDEMADVALKMKVRKPMTLPELIKATGKPAGELEPLLQQMAVVGLLEYNRENPRREKQYILPMFVPGSAEFFNMNKQQIADHPEVTAFFERMTFLPLEHITAMVPPGGAGIGMHVIPVEKAIETENRSADIEHISHWLKKYDGKYAAGPCSCRMSRAAMGEGCGDDPDDWCIGVGDMADYLVETNKGHYVTYDEVMQILQKAEDNGFVHQITNIDGENKIFAICNCNVNVCNALRTSQLFNTPNMSRSAYVARVEPENCVACGRCVEYCPAGAVKLGQKLCTKDGPITYPKQELPDAVKWGPDKWAIDYRDKNRINCYDTGTAPCKTACPAHIAVQGYLKMAAQGRYRDALALIKKENPFPAVCGRVCNRRCEDACTRGTVDQAVAIDEVKKFIAQQDLNAATRYVPPVVAPTNRGGFAEKIAVIGGGPGGLSAAYYLQLMGHQTTVYEMLPELGGMLRYGIPNYRLPKERLEDDIRSILKTGVQVKHGLKIGKDITIQELQKEYDAILIAIGASADKKLRLDHEDADGVLSAVEFLRSAGLGELPDLTGKQVVVVGGGNVSMDAVRTAKRMGAEKVSILYRRRRHDMTALPEEIEGAVAEGIELLTLKAPSSINVDENGRVRGIWATPQMVSAIKDGRAGIQPTGEPDVYIPCDVLIRAIGQDIETSHFEEAGVPVQRGKIITRSTGDFENMPGVFAGGDCASGPASVIKAIAAAKVVAANIDEYLGFRHEISCDVEIPDANLEDRTPCGRVNLTEREACQRVHDFEGVENCMTEKEARQEADRCLRCDHFGYGIFKGGRDTIW